MCYFNTGHPIFSIDIHPDDEHLATGGQGIRLVVIILRNPCLGKCLC